ncbi:MAG: hypothetical protein ABJC12_12240, partial [Saprospiraceae bacterium]
NQDANLCSSAFGDQQDLMILIFHLLFPDSTIHILHINQRKYNHHSGLLNVLHFSQDFSFI